MGLEDELDVTDDIGTADAILASSSEMKQNPWIRGVAKFHQLPVFVIKVYFCHTIHTVWVRQELSLSFRKKLNFSTSMFV